jgi:hypothetical protein
MDKRIIHDMKPRHRRQEHGLSWRTAHCASSIRCCATFGFVRAHERSDGWYEVVDVLGVVLCCLRGGLDEIAG